MEQDQCYISKAFNQGNIRIEVNEPLKVQITNNTFNYIAKELSKQKSI